MNATNPFVDWPDADRQAARAIVDAHGGYIAGYTDDGLTVAMPVCRAARRAILDELDVVDLHWDDAWRFPLGSDGPPKHLRHGGYWLYYRFLPAGLRESVKGGAA